jgi:hypothetical protein
MKILLPHPKKLLPQPKHTPEKVSEIPLSRYLFSSQNLIVAELMNIFPVF